MKLRVKSEEFLLSVESVGIFRHEVKLNIGSVVLNEFSKENGYEYNGKMLLFTSDYFKILEKIEDKISVDLSYLRAVFR